MSKPMNLPTLGENIDGGDVVKVLVKAGDVIRPEQPILELETGKATVEVPAPSGGRIEAVHVKPGDKIAIGQLIFTLAGDGAPAAPAAAAAASPAKARTPAAPKAASPAPAAAPAPAPSPAPSAAAGERELKLPSLGENVEGGDITKLLVKTGDTLRREQPILEIETGKATIEVPSPDEGAVVRVLVKAGDKVKVGQPVLVLSGGAAAPAPAAPAAKAAAVVGAALTPAAPAAAAAAAPEPTPRPVLPAGAIPRLPVAAAPSVRRFAREIGVNVEEIKGSGAGGRISVEDVKKHARQVNTGRKIHGHCALETVPLPDFTKFGPVQKESMSKIRVATAEHLARAWATIPHVTQHEKADITELEVLRKRFAARTEAAGGKLTVTAILLKVVAAALKVFPRFNASVDMSGREIVYKKYYNIGVAVDTERGLLVPVVRDVDRKNIVQIAVELGELAKRAREGRISPDDLSGGTFTVTNLGAIGGSFFTPIINAPEVAILGVSRAVKEPVYTRSGELEGRLMMPLSLSYDHRLIDGADGARFLRWIVEASEEPMLISLEG